MGSGGYSEEDGEQVPRDPCSVFFITEDRLTKFLSAEASVALTGVYSGQMTNP